MLQLSARRLPRLAIIGLLVALLAGLHGAAPTRAAVADGTLGKVAGAVVSMDGSPAHQLASGDFGRIRRAGMNTAVLYVSWDIDPVTQTVVAPGPLTIPDADVLATMAQARAAGLAPVLHPIFECRLCANPWRGLVHPANVELFFDSYRLMVDHYADLASVGGASLLIIGSEMNSLQPLADQWRAVAREARQHFGGRLSYVANWDAIGSVGFWDALDLVGVSAYFPLTDDEHPTVQRLMAGWQSSTMANFRGRRWVAELADLSRRTRKPVLFGEVGYRSITRAGQWPFDSVAQRPADRQSQLNAYEALLRTFERQPWWAGAVWWEWFGLDGGAADTSFNPRDKPVERFLTKWYRLGWRPGDPAVDPAPTPSVGPVLLGTS